MFELYHNALSTCSQKVRMALAEKALEFQSHPVDLVGGGQHDPAFVALSPKHVVPVLVDRGRVVRESSIINEYINDTVPEPPLAPENPYARASMRLWIKRVDEDIHGHTSGVFTHAIWTHRIVGGQSAENIAAYLDALPNPAERELRRSLLANGAAAPEFVPALRRMAAFLDDLDSALAENRWLVGEQFTLADIGVTPYIERLDSTGLSALWQDGRRPHLARWLTNVRQRPSYTRAFSDWIPPPMATGLASLVELSAGDIALALSSVNTTAQSEGVEHA